MTNETAFKVRPAAPGQYKEIYGLLPLAVPTNLTFEGAEMILRDKSAFIEGMAGLFPDPEALHNPIKQWEMLYREEFGESHDFSGVTLLQPRGDFKRRIIVAKGMTLNRAYEACLRRFPSRRYDDDLDAAISTNDREPMESYGILVRDCREADEELANLSADDLGERGTKCVTTLERMLLELKYFRETGKRLDRVNISLCVGSRYSGGNVPFARWNDGEFLVGRLDCRSRYPYLRAREAVTL